uniref:phosphoglycerate mutase (2,3-diphosphoglycerate-dependent) n=1 Tax=Minutocellus polymorphus TaxID=265543 RepID=A0A7S0AFH5_9STRA
MPNGVPFVYRFDKEMNPIKPGEDSLTQVHASGTFLEKPGLLKKALKRQEDWAKLVPGFDTSEVDTGAKRVTTLENSLLKLRNEQTVEAMVEESAASESDDGSEEFNGTDGNLKLMNEEKATVSTSQDYERWEDDPCEFEEFGFFASSDGKEEPLPLNVVPLPDDADSKKQEDAVVVLIRHGRTPHNNLGLFTGWEDPPLADDGVEDAKNAGRLLKRHGFEFDVVYTSWLTRAIQTAWYVMDELDVLWLPMVKSWRLNERMYGALTGKSKAMVANEYGEEQLKKWRRGFAIRPPPTSSYSFSYPGNDLRRTKYVKDLRISWSESIIRSIESRKLQIHRKFPKSESLKDCMARSIPFYTDRICNEAVNKGKRVLITSHENALRGILMHLCDIPVEAMNQLHLPNGLPLVYSVKGKCITLLDDGSGKDPMEEHDFGPAAKYLFKPCEITDEFYIEMEKRAEDVTAVVTADVATIEKDKVAA